MQRRTFSRIILILALCSLPAIAQEGNGWQFDSIGLNTTSPESDAQQVYDVLLKMLDRWNAHDILLAVGQLAFRDRIEAQDSFKQPIGKPIEQPYRRLEDQIEQPQWPADPQSRWYGLADGERFRREFPQNDMKDRDGAKG